MPEDRHAGDERESDPLLAVVADPERGQRQLPFLLQLIDSEDPQQRLRGAFALCLVAEATPDMLGPIVRRLVDRLDEDPPVAIPHALDYLAARNPRAVDSVVSDLAEEREVKAREFLYQSGGGFARNEYLAPGPGDRTVGRTRLPGGSDAGPPTVHTTGVNPEDVGAGERDGGTDGDGDSPSDDGPPDGTAEEEDSRADLTSGALAEVSRRLSAVIERSRFDDLSVLTERRRERFGDRYRAVGTLGDSETALTVSVFRIPRDVGEATTQESGASFAQSFRQTMTSWSGVDDHESIQTVHDWDVRPRPWATLEYTGTALGDYEAFPLSQSVATAIDIADGIAHAHQHGVVHGAMDPQTVAYPDATLTETERQTPRVTAVGLARVYAAYHSLSNFLDPRYAAPEHYTDRFGRVDHATDVYSLGALLYRLATGEPPYDGRPETIRERVLAADPPIPSDVDPDLPVELDQVVGKAMARQKLTRYETVTIFRQELRGIDTDGG